MNTLSQLCKRVEDLESTGKEHFPGNNVVIYQPGTNPEYVNDQENGVIFLIPDNGRDVRI